MSQVFTRSSQLADKIYDVKLHIPEWKVLFAADGKKDAAAIADFLDLQQKEVEEAFTHLSELGILSPLKTEEEEPTATAPEEISGLEEEPAREKPLVPEETPAAETAEAEAAAEIEKETAEEAAAETETVEKPTELDELISELDEQKKGAEEAVEPEIGEEELSPEAELREFEESSETEIKEIVETGQEETEGLEVSGEEKIEKISEEAKVPESDEELDSLIDDLLKGESGETSGEETVAPPPETVADEEAAPGEGLESLLEKETGEEKFETPVETKAEKDVDLGDIFQSELSETEQSLEDMLETMETEEVATPEVEEKKVEPPLAGGAPQKTILVVDDSVVIRKMVEIALENENYNIVSVANGKDALAYLDEKEPDIVILDIMLPDVNGLDILKAIKASKNIPVVMLSAKDTPRETSKAKELGADDFIPKPFKDEELVGKIQELVGE